MGVGYLHSRLFSAPTRLASLILLSARAASSLSMPGNGNFRSVTLSLVV